MIPTLVFDIETIPDTVGLRALLDAPDVDLSGATDEDIANIALHQRRQKNGTASVGRMSVALSAE